MGMLFFGVVATTGLIIGYVELQRPAKERDEDTVESLIDAADLASDLFENFLDD